MHLIPPVKELHRYALRDAEITERVVPDVETLEKDVAVRTLARFMATSGTYLEGDLNLDNQKRNVAIRLFIEYPLSTVRQHGVAWLERWRLKYGSTPWFKEWDQILHNGTDDALTHILLSCAEEPTRQRSSMPFTGLLSPEVVVQIKRSGVPV